MSEKSVMTFLFSSVVLLHISTLLRSDPSASFVTYTIIQCIMRSEMCSLHLNPSKWSKKAVSKLLYLP